MKIRLAEIIFIVLLSIVIFNGVKVVYSFLTGGITLLEYTFGLALVMIAFGLSFLIYAYFIYTEPIIDRDTLEKWAEQGDNQEKEVEK